MEVHGDNIKPYKGTERLDWFQASAAHTIEAVIFPCLEKYSRGCLERDSERNDKDQHLKSESPGVSQGAVFSPTLCVVDINAGHCSLQKIETFSFVNTATKIPLISYIMSGK